MKKDKRNTFENLKMVLTIIFEEVINLEFYSISQGLPTRGFGTTPPVDNFVNLQRLYGKPSYQELDITLLHLNKPMNQINPVEVMLRGIEEVQQLLPSDPVKDCALTELNLINYALIKL